MGEMPLVAVFESDPHQIRSDATRAEQVWHVEDGFAGLTHRAPAARLAGHRTHELGMAIPATLAQIDVAPVLLQRRVFGCLGQHPFELAEVGADHRGHPVGSRGRFEKGQETLGDEGGEEAGDAGHQENKPGAHWATPPVGTGAGPNAGRSAAVAGRASAVIIRLMTSSDMPISMLTPATVRTSQ